MTTPVVGNDIKVWVTREATFDTSLAIAAGDAVAVLECEIKPSLEYHKSKEHTGSATLQTEIQGKRGGTWKISCYVKTNAAGTPPDFGELLRIAFGTETDGASDVIYSLSTGAPESVQIAKYSGSGLFQQANGCWCEKVELEYKGNEEPTLTFSGGFASYGWVFDNVAVEGAHTAPDTTILLETGDGQRLGGAVRVKFGAEDNAGAGYLISTPAADTVSISPTLANNISDAVVVTPVLPSFTLGSGTIAGGIACGLSIGGTAVGAIGFKCTFDTGIHGLAKEATSNRPNRLSRGARNIELSGEFYYLEENENFLGSAWRGTTQAFIARFGEDTAGLRLKVNAPAARINVTSPDEQESDEATWAFTAVPRKSAANEDELNVTLD